MRPPWRADPAPAASRLRPAGALDHDPSGTPVGGLHNSGDICLNGCDVPVPELPDGDNHIELVGAVSNSQVGFDGLDRRVGGSEGEPMTATTLTAEPLGSCLASGTQIGLTQTPAQPSWSAMWQARSMSTRPASGRSTVRSICTIRRVQHWRGSLVSRPANTRAGDCAA